MAKKRLSFMDRERIAQLIEKFMAGTASVAEDAELHQWYREADLSDELTEPWQAGERQRLREKILADLLQELPQTATEPGAPVVSIQRRRRFRRLAAACLILLAVLGGYLLYFQHNQIASQTARAIIPADIKAPQTNRAMIRLSSGRQVYLDSVANGNLVQQGGIKVVKLADGKIVYSGTGTEMIYNTLSNPRGSRAVDITLSDGSRIWLNAGSAITYPVVFTGITRNVSMTGEGYFEISHDARKPFSVSKGDMKVTVFGTHFNINAYDDEKDMRVTLLEGSVKVSKGSLVSLLKPGEQAQVSDKIKTVSDADTEQVLAWRNGLFSFKSTDIKTIMRQIARWYDVKVDYAPGVPEEETITGDITQTANVSEVIKMLEFAGLHFTIDGKTVIVKP